MEVEEGQPERRCQFPRCAILIKNHTTIPLHNFTVISDSGMVSMDIVMGLDHISTTLVKMFRGNSSVTRLILGERGDLLLQDKDGFRTLKGGCQFRCRINLGWKQSCFEKVEERFYDNEINILLNRKPSSNDHGDISYVELVLADPGSNIILRDLVAFNSFSTPQEMRRKVFDTERIPDYPGTSLKWDEVVENCDCHGLNSSFVTMKDIWRVFPYRGFTPKTSDVTVEHYYVPENSGGSYKDTFLYINMKMKNDKACKLEHGRYLVQMTPSLKNMRFSICLELIASTLSSHLNIVHFVTQQRKPLTIMLDGQSLHLLRDLEDFELATIPTDGKAVVCVTVETVMKTNISLTVNIRSENEGWQEQINHTVNWFWIVGQEEHKVTLGLIDFATGKHTMISNVGIWDKILTVAERDQYLNNPSDTERSLRWKDWNSMLRGVVNSETLGTYFTNSKLQVIPPSTTESSCRSAVTLPSHVQCPTSCEYIPFWELCQTPCIDSTSICEKIDHYRKAIRLNKIVTHRELPENLLYGLSEATVCLAMGGYYSGTFLDYGGRSLLIHIQSVESILVIVHHTHRVFFPVFVSERIHRICIRVANRRVAVYLDGFERKVSSFQGNIPDGTFGKGTMTLFHSADSGIPIGGEIHGLNVWGRGLTDIEMAIFSSVQQCASQPDTVLSWKEIGAAIEGENVKISSRLCDGTDLGINFLDLNTIEAFAPPPSLGKKTTVITANQMGNLETFSLGVSEQLCLSLNVSVPHKGKRYKIIMGLENQLGLSHRSLTIESPHRSSSKDGVQVENICYFCKETQLVVEFDLLDNETDVCIRDTRQIGGNIAGFPVTNSTGMVINKILLVEQRRKQDWSCQEHRMSDKLFGEFIWTSTETSADAICPYGKKGNDLFIAYAQRFCIDGSWSNDNDTKLCQYKLEHDSLEYLLNTTEKGGNVLNGVDLRIAVAGAVKIGSSGIDSALFQRTLDHIQDTLDITMEEGENLCWFLEVLNTIYVSPHVDLFPDFKKRFMPRFIRGDFPHDASCSENIFQSGMTFNADEYRLQCSSSPATVCTMLNSSQSSDGENYNLTAEFDRESNQTVTLTFFKTIPGKVSKAFSNEVRGGKVGSIVRVVSDVINVYLHPRDEKNMHGELRVTYTFKNSPGKKFQNAYCVKEYWDGTRAFNWSNQDIRLLTRTKEEVTCEVTGDNQTVALVQNMESHDQRKSKHKLVLKLTDGIVIFLLLCTALIAASRVHHCIVVGNLMVVTCVLYSTYYLARILCDTQGTKEKVLACWQCGALQMFLLLAVSLFLLCGAAGLHVAIEDSYDVEFFITKSTVLSLGVAVLIVVCLSVADVVTSPQYTSLFLTADTLTDMSPLGCRVTLPLRFQHRASSCYILQHRPPLHSSHRIHDGLSQETKRSDATRNGRSHPVIRRFQLQRVLGDNRVEVLLHFDRHQHYRKRVQQLCGELPQVSQSGRVPA
ncbi:hypothetical protein ACHWQZ_G002621 [Mnemiopsis leidyi]